MGTMVERLERAIAKELTGGVPSKPKSIDRNAALAVMEVMHDYLPQPVTVSMVPNSKYAEGWNDCLKEMYAALSEQSQGESQKAGG